MSYSRWSDSVWYTYADVNGGFTVCGHKTFSDQELKDLEKCIQFFRDFKVYTETELTELKGYMQEYLDESDSFKMETHSFD